MTITIRFATMTRLRIVNVERIFLEVASVSGKSCTFALEKFVKFQRCNYGPNNGNWTVDTQGENPSTP